MTMERSRERLDHTVRRLSRWADECDPGVMRVLARALDLPVRAAWHVWRNRPYLTVYKLLNMGLVNIEALLRRERMHGLPYVAKVEPTNICNSTCRLCPTGTNLPGRCKGKMSLEQFCRIIDMIKRHTYVVDLSNWGDPLVVPDIYRMIRYTHDARIWTYISSNLHAFNLERHDDEAIVQSRLDMLNCSLHAATQSTYEAYQPGKKLDVALTKIRAILDARRRLNSRTPVVQLFFVVTKHNEHEMADFRALAEDLKCEAVFIPASLNLRFASRAEWADKMREWLPSDVRWVAPWYRNGALGHHDENGTKKIYPCYWPWRETVINWDGAVSVCCGDYDPRWEMGNIFRDSLRTIWNGEAYRAARRSFKRSVNGLTGEPCRSCPGVMI